MASDTLPGRVHPVHAPALFGLLVVGMICATRAVLNDGDTYTHVAAGSWMLEHRSVLTADPFSATFAGQAWSAHEWLAELVFGAAYRAAGLSGVMLVSAAAGGLAFANLARHVGRYCGWMATMMLVTAALVCALPSLLARPHLLALPVMEAWVAGLVAARAAGRAPAWWMLGLMVVWANLHGGFAFGLALTAVFAAEAAIRRDRSLGRWGVFLAGAVLAGALTPQGLAGLTFPVRLLGLHSLSFIKEWQPLNLSTDVQFEVVLLGLVVLLGSGRIRVGWFPLLLLAGLLHMAFAHSRHAMLFGVVGALLLAEPVGRGTGGVEWGMRARVGWRVCWAAIAGVALLRLAVPVALADGPASPVSALAQVPEAVRQEPVLNSNQFGGYLELAGLRPFIDGRVELFGDAFVGDYLAMSEGSVLAARVGEYGFGWALLAVGDPLVGAFEGLAGWRRVYEDRVAVVFVREG